MTTTTPPQPTESDNPTAEDVVDEHRSVLEQLAAEDTRVGNAARAFLETTRGNDDE